MKENCAACGEETSLTMRTRLIKPWPICRKCVDVLLALRMAVKKEAD